MVTLLRTVSLFLLLLSIAWQSALGADWPQFRGPNCTGISATIQSLPVEFSATENVAWKAAIGDGVGSPVISQGRVFVSTVDDAGQIALIAFDLNTGDELWRRTWDAGKLPDVHHANSHASTTPAVDDERVYFYSSKFGIRALDVATGEEIWYRPMPVPFFVFKWGPAMSPVLCRDKLIFCQDDDLYPAIYALDKRTGEIQWKDERYDMAVNYSHPVLLETDQGPEVVVAGTGMLVGYDLETGKRLWHARLLLRNIKTTPVAVGDTVYVSLQSRGIANQWLATADRSETGNSDGKLTKAEMQASVGDVQIPPEFFARTFDRGDMDGDGFLVGAELDAAFLHPDNFAGASFDVEDPADEYIMAVRGGGRGDVTQSHLIWRHKTKYTDHVVSPFVHDGRMFLIKGGGITTVFETTEGSPVRGPKRLPNTGGYLASPVYGDGKIYAAGEDGVIVVLADGEDYEVLATCDMGESIVATPAIADGAIVIRSRDNLWCVQSP